jgi:hypothetical protein
VTARPPHNDRTELPGLDSLADLLGSRRSGRGGRGSRGTGLLGALLSAVAGPPKSTGPCFDKINMPRDH